MKERIYEVQSLTILLLRILWQPMSPGLVGMLFNLNGLGRGFTLDSTARWALRDFHSFVF